MKTRAALAVLLAALFTPAAAQQLPPPELPYGDGLIATVNEERIFGADVLREIEDVIPGLRNAHPDPADFEQEFRAMYVSALLSLIDWKVVEHEARKIPLTVPDTELDAQERDEIRHAAGGDREKYKALLQQKGLTIERAREGLRRQVLMMKVVRNEINPAALYVSPEELRRYFADHPAEFRRPERVRPRILRVVAASGGAQDRARRMAESLRRQLDAGADFEAIRRWTDGEAEAPSTESEWRIRGDLDASLEAAVFSAEKGSVVGPIEAAGGYYLARVEDREPAVEETFEEAQERIHSRLYRERIVGEHNAAVVRLLRRAIVNIVPPEVAEYQRRRLAEAPQPK
ncbi:MAG: peptidyl-prolyl cis-trans isomerase [Planctomycetes bacterium]|nr:peptidyl-prolyl cis-trans isomerase [Planctomycetota bacterium]